MSRYSLFATLFLIAFFSLAGAANAQTTDRAQVAAEIESLREQIKSKESLLLAPSNEDKEAYAEFLSQPDTGLVRLLPRETWDGKLSLRGGGAYYSFTKLTHEYGYGSDISLEQGQLGVGFAGADFGFVINLGDIPLANVTLEAEGIKFLAAFTTPSVESAAREQRQRAGHGFEAEGRRYRNRAPVAINNTYALRSINYDTSDVLVTFRVIRKDSDDSVVILWKMLKKFPLPRLERNSVAVGM